MPVAWKVNESMATVMTEPTEGVQLTATCTAPSDSADFDHVSGIFLVMGIIDGLLAVAGLLAVVLGFKRRAPLVMKIFSIAVAALPGYQAYIYLKTSRSNDGWFDEDWPLPRLFSLFDLCAMIFATLALLINLLTYHSGGVSLEKDISANILWPLGLIGYMLSFAPIPGAGSIDQNEIQYELRSFLYPMTSFIIGFFTLLDLVLSKIHCCAAFIFFVLFILEMTLLIKRCDTDWVSKYFSSCAIDQSQVNTTFTYKIFVVPCQMYLLIILFRVWFKREYSSADEARRPKREDRGANLRRNDSMDSLGYAHSFV